MSWLRLSHAITPKATSLMAGLVSWFAAPMGFQVAASTPCYLSTSLSTSSPSFTRSFGSIAQSLQARKISHTVCLSPSHFGPVSKSLAERSFFGSAPLAWRKSKKSKQSQVVKQTEVVKQTPVAEPKLKVTASRRRKKASSGGGNAGSQVLQRAKVEESNSNFGKNSGKDADISGGGTGTSSGAKRRRRKRKRGGGGGPPAPPPQPAYNPVWWERRLRVLLSNAGEQEIIVRDSLGARGPRELQSLAEEKGLYFRAYGDQKRKILVISKAPLPNYRADCDPKFGQKKSDVNLPDVIQQRVQMHLEALAASQSDLDSEDDVSDDDDALSSASDAEKFDYKAFVRRKGENPQRKAKLSEMIQEKQLRQQSTDRVRKMLRLRERLPAFEKREELLAAIANNQVMVVSGETGCGKTTQMPQFVLESEIEAGRGADVNIICTQPRRISAISVASRVAAERGEEIGDTVGYQVRLESKQSSSTRLRFCTTGVLLRKLVADPTLTGVSHVIVDEIHERGMNEDFLIVILRDILPKRPDLRLVLMSATINADLFSDYFGGAPTAHIPGFTYPVKQHFLENVLEMTRHVIYGEGDGRRRLNGGGARDAAAGTGATAAAVSAAELWEAIDVESDPEYDHLSPRARSSLANWDPDGPLNHRLLESLLAYICTQEPEPQGDSGAILVFLTGWDEISTLDTALKRHPVMGNPNRVKVLPLHSSLPTANQKEIFDRPPPGVRKIVLATNIAETSITIDDVVYVVDCGKAKETSYDALNKLACLRPTWISRASAHQRKGRAGRVREGQAFHLYPKKLHDMLPAYQLPELLRTPLQELCLQIKSLGLGKIRPFLQNALQPPDPQAVENAIELLETIGALDADENLTSLGSHLSALPVEPRVGKMLLMGAIFNCLGPALTIAAGLAHRDPFVLPLDRRESADEVRRDFAGNDRSDHITLLRAYDSWRAAYREKRERDWCWQNFLSPSTLRMIHNMRMQFLDLLEGIGFVEKGSTIMDYNEYGDDMEVVRAVLCAGLFPSVIVCRPKGRRVTLHTREDGRVTIHPASVNHAVNSFPAKWLIYNQKVSTGDTNILVRDSTMVTDYALLLFGGQPVPTTQGFSMLNGYLHFSATPKTAALVGQLRSQLDRLLQRKIEDPTADIHTEGAAVVSAVRELLHHDARAAVEEERARVNEYREIVAKSRLPSRKKGANGLLAESAGGGNAPQDTGRGASRDTGRSAYQDTGRDAYRDGSAWENGRNAPPTTSRSVSRDTSRRALWDNDGNVPQDTGRVLPWDTGRRAAQERGGSAPQGTGRSAPWDTGRSAPREIGGNAPRGYPESGLTEIRQAVGYSEGLTDPRRTANRILDPGSRRGSLGGDTGRQGARSRVKFDRPEDDVDDWFVNADVGPSDFAENRRIGRSGSVERTRKSEAKARTGRPNGMSHGVQKKDSGSVPKPSYNGRNQGFTGEDSKYADVDLNDDRKGEDPNSAFERAFEKAVAARRTYARKFASGDL